MDLPFALAATFPVSLADATEEPDPDDELDSDDESELESDLEEDAFASAEDEKKVGQCQVAKAERDPHDDQPPNDDAEVRLARSQTSRMESRRA